MRRKQVPIMHRASVEVHRIGSMGKSASVDIGSTWRVSQIKRTNDLSLHSVMSAFVIHFVNSRCYT